MIVNLKYWVVFRSSFLMKKDWDSEKWQTQDSIFSISSSLPFLKEMFLIMLNANPF